MGAKCCASYAKEGEALLALNVEAMPLSADGHEGFYWPISYAERKRLCDDFITAYTALIRQYDHYEMIPYTFMAKDFIMEFLGVFNAQLLRKRMHDDNYAPRFCKTRFRVWSAVFSGQAPADIVFMDALRNGPKFKAKAHKFRFFRKLKQASKLLSFKGGGLTLGALKIKPMVHSVLQNDIIATQRSMLIQRHAQDVDCDVVYCNSERWFRGISDAEISQSKTEAHTEFEAAVVDLILQQYAAHSLEVDESILKYLKGMMHRGAACVRVHYKRLIQAPDSLPQRAVWTGSGGNLWDGLLRMAALNVHGAEVCGHDHGAALGHVDYPMMGFTEFWGCTQFYCLNANQAKEMQERAVSWYKMQMNLPELLGPAVDTGANPQIYERFKSNKNAVKTIIVLATVYGGDRVWMGPCSPDIVHVDWQVRLVSKLREWGYNVIVKVHPETPVMPPKILEDLGAEIRSEPLEEMVSEGDLVLFDCVFTTVFRSVLSTNVPMVLIDFYGHPWTKKALDLLQQRVGFLYGGFDKKNREDVDWDALKSTIENAAEKSNNHNFFRYYYGA